MKKKVFIFIFFCSLLTSLQSWSQSSKYISKYQPLADSLSEVYDIPSNVILGIAVMESANGKCRNSVMLNNHFGIVGKNNLLETHNIVTMYKQYATAKESFIDFCKVITRKKFYSDLRGVLDYKKWVAAISQAGYSTVPSLWLARVTNVIEKAGLD